MTVQIWPFKPRDEMIESLEWKTDVFRAKSAEQRMALRTAPRRTFNLDHTLTDYQYAGARALIRDTQGGDGFLVPDWGQSIKVGSVSSGSAETISVDLSYVDMGDTALLWESSTKYESVGITNDSSGVVVDSVGNDYTDARLMPLWTAVCPEGLVATRIGARLNQSSIAFLLTQNNDLGASSYSQYRSHDVIPSCPVIGGGDLEESIVWPVTQFDNQQSSPYFLRQRDIPNMAFSMRWHEFSSAEIWDLRRWLHSRRGRQKVFWLSSRGKDFEPYTISADSNGATLTTYAMPGISGVGRSGVFDIDITTNDDNSYYRRVESVTTGTPVGGRETLDLLLDENLTINAGDIKRVSFLRCARFNADRVEMLHRASGGVSVQIPCVEVEQP
jgi:hypothetical protein